MVCFLAPLTFPDGPTATVCGFCRPDRADRIKRRLKSLEQTPFGPLKEGILIDHRFIRLLREVLEPERESLYLVGGSIRVNGADAPCGGVLGRLFDRAESAREAPDSISLPTGHTLRLLLRPGQGGTLFSCADPAEEEALYASLAREFPAPRALERLEQETEACLYVLDYSPGHPILNGSCFARLKNHSTEGR